MSPELIWTLYGIYLILSFSLAVWADRYGQQRAGKQGRHRAPKKLTRP